MYAAPESLEFLKGTQAGEDEQWATQTSNGTWRIRVTSQSWDSGGPLPHFPGDGDRILFYVRARFHVVFQLGVVSDGAEHYYDPALIEMTPIGGPWTTVAVTVAQLRSGDLPSSVPLDADAVGDLLRLDPFTGAGFGSFGKRPLGQLGLVAVDNGTPSDPNLSSRRFTQVSEIPDVWWPCGSSTEASQSVELGESDSTTVTRSHSTTTDVTGVGVTTFTFEYSVNRMTESSSTTEAVARFGGGTECSAEAPMYETETWYDTMSGSLAFPTSEYQPGNIESLVLDAGGTPLSYQALIIQDAEGRRVRTRTGGDGLLRLRLEPGHYSASVEGQRGLEQSFDVLGTSGLTRLEPLRFGDSPQPRGSGLPLPLVAEPSPTPTATPDSNTDIRNPRQATSTPMPDPIERRPVLPTATSTPSTLRNLPGR
jgi:hypothetical protein